MNRINYNVSSREREQGICAGDKIFFDSIVKRAKLVMQDMFIIADRYEGIIPSDTLGAMYSLTVLIEDIKDSAVYGNNCNCVR